MEKILNLKPAQKGTLIDGRKYEIISIPKISVNVSGVLKQGDIEIYAYDDNVTEKIIMTISEFLENVSSIGNLEIK